METPQINGIFLFDEKRWLETLFLMNDTQTMINGLMHQAIQHIPMSGRKKLFRKNYYLSISALAHIVERHYYKVPSFADAGKFTIPLAQLMCHLRDGYEATPVPIPDSYSVQRTLHTDSILGYDREHIPTQALTIITDLAGRIITAFPGVRE